MQVRDARHLATLIANDALVNPGVSRPNVKDHESVVAVTRVVGYAVLVTELQRLIVVIPLARRRHRRVDLTPEVRHRSIIQVLVTHWFQKTRCRHARRVDVDYGCTTQDSTRWHPQCPIMHCCLIDVMATPYK